MLNNDEENKIIRLVGWYSMKLDPRKVLTTFEDEPIMNRTVDGPVPATFKMIVVDALNSPTRDDQGKPFAYFMDLYNLAKKVAEADNEIEFNLEELNTMKQRITNSGHTTITKGRVYEMLEGK
jgi:hypothetical protein